MTGFPCDLKLTTAFFKDAITICLRATADRMTDVAVSLEDWFNFVFPNENYYIDLVVGTERHSDTNSTEATEAVATVSGSDISDGELVDITDNSSDAVAETIIEDQIEETSYEDEVDEVEDEDEDTTGEEEDTAGEDEDTAGEDDTTDDDIGDIDEEVEDVVVDGDSYFNLTHEFTSRVNREDDTPITFNKEHDLVLDVRTCHNGNYYKYVYDCQDVETVEYPVYTRDQLDALASEDNSAPNYVLSAEIQYSDDKSARFGKRDVTDEVNEYAGPEKDFYVKQRPDYKLKVSHMLIKTKQYPKTFFGGRNVTNYTEPLCPEGSQLIIIDNSGNKHTFEHNDVVCLVPKSKSSSWFGY